MLTSNGAFWLINNQRPLIDAEYGINEGAGGQLENGKPVLNRIQVAEKMYATYQLESTDKGGHSSVPTTTNPVYALSASLTALGNYHFPVKLSDVTKTYFARSAGLPRPAIGRHERSGRWQPVGRGRAAPVRIAALQRHHAHHLRGDRGER